jgi:cytochrome oxidase Cu insertion factor (SCO1/SenC/PrrC family)
VVLYFGYTGCGAECPTTLLRLGRVAREHKFQLLFVSIDPHDTPQSMHNYLDHFQVPMAAGLTGTRDAITTLARDLRAANTLPAHATALYVFDGTGRARYLLTFEHSDAAIAAAIDGSMRD